MTRTFALIGLFFLQAMCVTAADPQPSASAPAPVVDRATLEKRFAERMTHVALEGHFTDSTKKEGELSKETYIIKKAVKDLGDNWLLTVVIRYAKYDVPVSLKIPVLWAGDTPVLSVTNLTVPLLGTFNARVVLYEDRYDGTWSGGGHSGHLFGKIVKYSPAPEQPKAVKKKPEERERERERRPAGQTDQ
jgi:hypothetical protein